MDQRRIVGVIALRRILLRAAVLIGGCTAGLALGLTFSGVAQADDRPRLLDGLVRDTVTDVIKVVDTILPPNPATTPDPQPQPQPKPKKSKRPTPVRDAVKDAVKETRETTREVVAQVVDVVTPPPADVQSTPDPNPQQPDPTATPDGPVDTSDPELPAVVNVGPTATARNQPTVSDHTPAPAPTTPDCHAGQRHHTPGSVPVRHQRTAGAPAERQVSATTSGYTRPAPPTPADPGHDATPAISTPGSPTVSLDLADTMTDRASMPRTTAVRIPGRDLAADGVTRRPDAPSG